MVALKEEKLAEAKRLLRQTRDKVPKVAREMAMSQSRFSKAFKEATGLYPAEYRRAHKHWRLRRYMRRTDLTLLDVTTCLSLKSATQLWSDFKLVHGVHPLEYRRQENHDDLDCPFGSPSLQKT